MAITDVKQLWAAHYESIPRTVEEQGVQEAVRWILKRGPWTYNNLRRKWFSSLGIGEGTTLLQAGCGIGKSGIAEALLVGCQVTLLDYSPRALASAKRVVERLSVNHPELVSRVHFVQAGFEDLAFENCFDVTFNEGVLEHWFEDAERVEILRLLAKATKVGGKVMVFVPNQKNHLYRTRIAKLSAMDPSVPPEKAFTSEELRQRMEEAGLTDVRVEGFAPHLSFGGYTGFKALAFVAWLFQQLLPRRLFAAYGHRYGFFLVGIGTKR
ncbi:MAG: hypothetical protein DMG28_10865 [Acidobacteria bacterium]|nr:MAG: hypothetical protein DMG28_10865 [Acidobacteriota bacterium]HLB89690.1 methyltransferase domain-containing protein [Terriglobales bacterium]